MLKVFKLEEIKKENVEFDIYTPVNIEFGVWNISEEPTIYWRTGDFCNSLIEIGIGKYKKDIRSITLTICKDVYVVDNYGENSFNRFKGSPILELENTNDETFTDENGTLKVYIENTSISVIFSDNKINDCLENGSVDFYLDDNKSLIGLRINNISEDNKAMLKEALE
ncbi:hypothetical protein J2Z44_001697 [Clostridium punense]|uniref:Uncharacterized protein n=2 Tax=Clostridium TaxID=1485 RepID=A0ABS4K446_9CLOT|nr:hypothetical protein [Clostridium punense]EQB89811.1 hypothetical protein M918_18835 [Clostridium sp. BL8]MBP2021901.1 hypothetical protein [Clostridium punense]